MARPNRLTRLPRIGDGKLSFIPNDADHDGWLLLSNTVRMVGKARYPKLFAMFGTAYGGTVGSSTFGLPAAGDKFLLMAGGNRELGQTGGSETVKLTTAQMPKHSHTEVKATLSDTPPQQALLPGGGGLGLQQINKPPTVAVSGAQTSEVGGDQPHDNMPPFLAVNVFIFAGLPVD